jgi:hypothetical protein
VLPREYVSGESLHYLGRRYRLKVIVEPAASVKAHLRGAFITVTVPEHDTTTIRSALEEWYRQRAREAFAQRLLVIAGPLQWVRRTSSNTLINRLVGIACCCKPTLVVVLEPRVSAANHRTHACAGLRRPTRRSAYVCDVMTVALLINVNKLAWLLMSVFSLFAV